MATTSNNFNPLDYGATAYQPPQPSGASNQSGKFDPFAFGATRAAARSHRFADVSPETSQERMARIKADERQAQEESRKANSVSGFLKNTVSAPIMETAPFVGGATALAKTANKAFDNPFDRNSDTIKTLTDQQVALTKQITDATKTGKTSLADKLKKIYNSNADEIDRLNDEIGTAREELPTTGKAVGQVIHTAADALTTGAYGKAASGMKSFEMAGKTAQLPTLAEQVAGLFKSKGSAHSTALNWLKTTVADLGAGYGYDVATNLEEGKTGGEAAVPGAMTLFGGVLPTGIQGAMLAENVVRGGLSNAIRLYRAVSPNEKAIAKEVEGLQSAWQDFFGRKKSTMKVDAKAQKYGTDNARILAEHGYMPDIKNGALDTNRIYQSNNDDIVKAAEGIQSHLETIDRNAPTTARTSLKEFQDILSREIKSDVQIKNSGTIPQAEAEAARRMQSFAQSHPEGFSLGELNRIRTASNRNTSAFNKPQFEQDVDNIIGNVARKLIDQKSDSKVVRQVNEKIGELRSINNLLNPNSKQTINGDKVNFGKVSQYFARVIGAISGSALPYIGPILGAMGGDMVVRLLNDQAFGGAVRRAILSEMKNNPKLLEQFSKEMSAVEFKALEREIKSVPLLPKGKGGVVKAEIEAPIHMGGATTFEPRAEQVNNPKARYLELPPPSGKPLGTDYSPAIQLREIAPDRFQAQQNKAIQDQLPSRTQQIQELLKGGRQTFSQGVQQQPNTDAIKKLLGETMTAAKLRGPRFSVEGIPGEFVKVNDDGKFSTLYNLKTKTKIMISNAKLKPLKNE